MLIIGGGIVGAGVARDAAMRGLKTGLVEQHDFAFGTSSRSSRLLHGGLRYLAQGRVGLVHEASVEKKVIHHIAPHLAEPLPFIFPTYRGNRNWVLWQLKIGVKIYDLLCGGRNLGKSTWLNTDEVMCKVPGLQKDALSGAVRYYDGFTNDARLTLDTLRSAANAGATILNYCRFQNAKRVDGRSNPLTPALSPSAGARENNPPSPGKPETADSPVTTEYTANSQRHFPLPRGGGEGQGEGELGVGEHRTSNIEHPTSNATISQVSTQSLGPIWECEIVDQLSGRKSTVRARTIINATGPWADKLPHSRVKLRLTKGIHLVVRRSRVPVPETVVMTEGKRILFAIPWGERTILGTTDTDYDGPPDKVTTSADDVDYVLQIANHFFPSAKLTGQDVLSTWAGLRPLLADPNGKPSDLSRSHEITNPESGWWDVAGGKLTTYRLMAEQTVDQIVKQRLRSVSAAGEPAGRAAPLPCRTALEPLLPATETANVSGILPPEFTRRAVEHYVAREWAIHLDDVMMRRTSWHYYFPDAAQKAERVADWMGELLGWSVAQRTEELARYHKSAGSTLGTEPATIPPSQPHDQPAHSMV